MSRSTCVALCSRNFFSLSPHGSILRTTWHLYVHDVERPKVPTTLSGATGFPTLRVPTQPHEKTFQSMHPYHTYTGRHNDDTVGQDLPWPPRSYSLAHTHAHVYHEEHSPTSLATTHLQPKGHQETCARHTVRCVLVFIALCRAHGCPISLLTLPRSFSASTKRIGKKKRSHPCHVNQRQTQQRAPSHWSSTLSGVALRAGHQPKKNRCIRQTPDTLGRTLVQSSHTPWRLRETYLSSSWPGHEPLSALRSSPAPGRQRSLPLTSCPWNNATIPWQPLWAYRCNRYEKSYEPLWWLSEERVGKRSTTLRR